MPPNNRSRIIQKDDNLVIYAHSPVRRVMFFILFLLLSTTMIFAVDPATDLSGVELLKTIGYAIVLLALLGAAGWSNTTWFDRDQGTIDTVVSFFGYTVRRRPLAPVSKVEGIVLQKAALFQDDSSHGMRSGVFGTLFEPRAQLIRLFVETEDDRIRLDEGGEENQLKVTGEFFAQFLNVEFYQEELWT